MSGAERNADFDAVTVVAFVETDADEDNFDIVVRELERRCPVRSSSSGAGSRLRGQQFHWRLLDDAAGADSVLYQIEDVSTLRRADWDDYRRSMVADAASACGSDRRTPTPL